MVCVGLNGPVAPIGETHCEKRCSGTGALNECIRCDMECRKDWGACDVRRPATGPTCIADCECPLDGYCVNGQCVDSNQAGRRRIGICGGPDADCACSGGTCDSRGCCMLG